MSDIENTDKDDAQICENSEESSNEISENNENQIIIIKCDDVKKNVKECKKTQKMYENRGRSRGRKNKDLDESKRKRRSSSSCSSVALSTASITPERLKQLREIVDKAAQHHKTFIIIGRYPSIRDALKNRGWVQNFDLHRLSIPKQRQFDDDGKLVSVLARLQSTDETERLVISRLLRHTPVSFLWATSENIDWNSLSKTTLVSRFPRVYFTTKVGICNYLQQSHWFCESGISQTMFPRCYNISGNDDLDIFIKDFRLTACIGLLKKLVSTISDSNIGPIIFSENGKIPLKTVEFAVKRCTELVANGKHEDIDKETEERVWDHQWDQFLTYYYQFVHHDHKFITASEEQIKEIYNCSKLSLESVTPYWPQKKMDGINNLWIVKPAAKSRGRGITVMNKLEDIISKVSTFQSNEPRYVVQKYIETPLLIYNTKFDIRQWFLVTSVYPLTIWMYKESYLRFCSQLFSLTNMHESVHLSNNAIQCKFKNNSKRDRLLPDENMWDCYTFKTYLRSLGFSDRWESVIYNGMRECITGALLAAQEHMEHRRNCFELYGADFMLTEDLVPWLIEINSSPCMSPTTSVTARMCSQCLEDVIKVVIDKHSNKDADTGMFELAYKQQLSNPQPYMGMNLTLKGTKLQKGPSSRTNSKGSEELSQDLSSVNVRDAIQRLSDKLKPPIKENKDEEATSGISSGFSDSDNTRASYSGNKKRTYKKHCCVRRTSLTQAVARYKARNYEEIARRLRLTQNVHCKTVQLPQAIELFEWKKRVEQTKSDCRQMLLKLSQGEKKLNLIDEKHKLKIKEKRISLPEIKQSPKKEINNNTPSRINMMSQVT